MNNLKQLKNEEIINLIKKGIVTVSDIVDSGICPTCFDKNNKFNPQKRDIILELVKAAGEWTDDSMEKFDSYPTYVQNAFKFISDYLEEQGENIFAGNGDLSKNFRKYIDYRMHNIVIL